MQSATPVDLTSVLDESHVLIDSAYRESEMEVCWHVPSTLPVVLADRHGLIQVFLNLAKNSQRAMRTASTKRLDVTVVEEENKNVVIRFEDTGHGIASTENLFRPFQRGAESTGLGLYMSRAIMRSFGGELLYEPRPRGCCFAIVLHAYSPVEESVHA